LKGSFIVARGGTPASDFLPTLHVQARALKAAAASSMNKLTAA